MTKADMTGEPRVETGQVEAVTKGQDYRAPKLTVVGTVDDLTLAVSSSGSVDGLTRTGGGG